jgi:Fe-S oxidoreductase
MEITCPYCGESGGLMSLHRHLVEAHIDDVTTELDEETGKMRYVITCPFCQLKYQHAIKPRYRDPAFLIEYKMEIAMVAFDQMLYHLAKEHGAEIGLGDETVQPEGE